MTREPYASAKRVFWVVDSGSSHRGQKAIDRLAEQFPNAVMVHTSVHASWLNQVEVYFSIIQRKALSPNDFTHLDVVEQRLTRFEDRYHAAARPFKWKFTTTDLDGLLDRLDRAAQRRRRWGQRFSSVWYPRSHASSPRTSSALERTPSPPLSTAALAAAVFTSESTGESASSSSCFSSMRSSWA
jgi:hypothetical protein